MEISLLYQLAGIISFMFINGLIGGGHPFINLAIFAWFGFINKKLGILFFILFIIISFGELIWNVLYSYAMGWASGMGAHTSSAIGENLLFLGFLNSVLCLIALFWVWKVLLILFPNPSKWILVMGTMSYILGILLAIYFMPFVSWITTIVGIIFLILIIKVPMSLFVICGIICLYLIGSLIYGIKNHEEISEKPIVEFIIDLIEDIKG